MASNKNKSYLGDNKKKIVNRLSVIEGQINGVKKMIEDDKNYDDVITQLYAVERSVASLSNIVLQEYLYSNASNLEKENAKVVSLCAKVEEELSELDPSDKQEMLEGLGLDGSGLDKLITATYDILGLATYFTVGKDEVRAWTFKKGMLAPKCAGIIHSDFERGFIKAEVVSYNDLMKEGSMLAAKEKGLVRQEGKEYVMQDGDIVLFKFNV